MVPSEGLIVVSNRLPFVLHRREEDDSLFRKSSAGGLVTAVAPVMVQSGGNALFPFLIICCFSTIWYEIYIVVNACVQGYGLDGLDCIWMKKTKFLNLILMIHLQQQDWSPSKFLLSTWMLRIMNYTIMGAAMALFGHSFIPCRTEQYSTRNFGLLTGNSISCFNLRTRNCDNLCMYKIII